jgi:uncharacterized protein YcaQ
MVRSAKSTRLSAPFGSPLLQITTTTLRRFILGQQGLYPGRRWRGAAGVADAIRSGCVVQVDPLNVVARSHDIALYGRVLDYHPELLDAAIHAERLCFDWGGTVIIHPMVELPYWRVVMERKSHEPRREAFAAEYPDVIAHVYQAIHDQGPLSARGFEGSAKRLHGSYRSAKVENQALYYLWLCGKLMTHSRKGVERFYDLYERVAPAAMQRSVPPEEADAYFAQAVFREGTILTARSFRRMWAGTIERTVAEPEATAQLQAMLAAGEIVPIALESDPQTARFILASEMQMLQALHAGGIPAAWQPLEADTDSEMTFLAPLEIVSARGRAAPLFGFEYLWEVYKPAAKRRWGYYTLPILYGDRLVARFDSRMDRARAMLVILGFWLEDHANPDAAFGAALARGLRRFMAFVGAEHVDLSGLQPDSLRRAVAQVLHEI